MWSRLPDGVLLKSESSNDSLLFLVEILGIVDELGHLEGEKHQEGGGRETELENTHTDHLFSPGEG